MNSIIIRQAETQDAAPFSVLSAELGYPATEQELTDRLTLLIPKEDHLVLAAELNGKVLGWLHAFAAFRVESQPFVEIGGLVVSQSDRGHGIGRKLVHEASKWAHMKGVLKIRVRSNVVRKETHDFYIHIGFEQLKAQMVFSKASDAQ